MPKARSALIGWLVARLSRLRFPVLFVLAALLFLGDLVLPDAIPFVDELLLGLGTALLGSWRRRREEGTRETPPSTTPS
jgi:hypothetical protein